jgi:hypothetical protein
MDKQKAIEQLHNVRRKLDDETESQSSARITAMSITPAIARPTSPAGE